MTVSTTTRKTTPVVGNSVNTNYPFAFKVFDKTDLEFITTLLSTGVGTTRVLDSDYSVTLNADQNNNPGGNIVYPLVGLPLDATMSAIIVSNVPAVQALELPDNGGAFLASVVEDALDRDLIISQQLLEASSRSVRYPVTDTTVGGELPPQATRALKYLAFDASGNPVAATSSGGNVVSTAMQPVVAAASLAAGRAALDVPSNGETVLKTIVNAKGDIIGASANDTPAITSVGTDGQVLTASAAAGGGLVWTDFVRPNLIMNPNWLFDQINGGALYTVTGGGADVLGPDGWSGSAPVAPGVFKLRRLADPDNAALKCLEITCTTIDAAIAAADAYYIHTAIEGIDSASLFSGLASAAPITISFAFKSNVTGVYGISVANSALNRSYVGTITVPDAAEHTYIVQLTLDTAGVWLYDTGVGLRMRLCLAGGSNFQAVAGAWGATNSLTTAAQANFMSNVANVAYLKRVQLCPGNVVSAFSPADAQREFAKIRRYYSKSYDADVAIGAATQVGAKIYAFATAITQSGLNYDFSAPMRAVPTITWYSTVTGAAGQARNLTGGADAAVAATLGPGATNTNSMVLNAAAGVNSSYTAHYTATGVRLA